MPSEPYSKLPTPTNPQKKWKKKDRVILLSPQYPRFVLAKTGYEIKSQDETIKNMKQRGDQTSNLSYKLYELISSFIIIIF